MDYMTIQEAVEKWGTGQRRINTLCHEGRIEGACRLGRTWAISADAEMRQRTNVSRAESTLKIYK